MKNGAIVLLIVFGTMATFCSNQKVTKKNNTLEFRQLFEISSFDSAQVHIGEVGDNTDFKVVYDFNPIGEVINSAKISYENMIWKGAIRVTFKNKIDLKISIYGGFFSECSTGKIFIVPVEYLEKYKIFVNSMLN